jgi:hypothetical protein
VQVIAAAGGADPLSHLGRAYAEAHQAGYLWHEFGDSHLIVCGQTERGRDETLSPQRE